MTMKGNNTRTYSQMQTDRHIIVQDLAVPVRSAALTVNMTPWSTLSQSACQQTARKMAKL